MELPVGHGNQPSENLKSCSYVQQAGGHRYRWLHSPHETLDLKGRVCSGSVLADEGTSTFMTDTRNVSDI